jgi:hypothetical protein
LVKADTAFQGASVGQPTEPCLDLERARPAPLAVVAIVPGVAADRALAQSRTFYGADGRQSGRSVTDTKGNTIYSGQMT